MSRHRARGVPQGRDSRHAQQAAQDLADRRLGQLVDETIATRTLVAGQPGLETVVVERLLVHGLTELDESRHRLSPLVVGQAHHGDFRHLRMQRQHVLDFQRTDVFASGVDQVVDAPGDEQVALSVEIARIAGEIPALLNALTVASALFQ